jgi:hypothetical protein
VSCGDACVNPDNRIPVSRVVVEITMSTTELRALLDEIADTRELVLRRAASLGPSFNAVYDAWSDAHEEAEHAYGVWRTSAGRDHYAVYRAAQDREDAAQDALSSSGPIR